MAAYGEVKLCQSLQLYTTVTLFNMSPVEYHAPDSLTLVSTFQPSVLLPDNFTQYATPRGHVNENAWSSSGILVSYFSQSLACPLRHNNQFQA